MMTLSNSDDVPSGDGFLQKGTLELLVSTNKFIIYLLKFIITIELLSQKTSQKNLKYWDPLLKSITHPLVTTSNQERI